MVRSALILALLAASAPAAAVPPGFTAKADSILAAAYPAAGPGAAVIVTENGKTVYAAGRGLADIAHRTPITPSTVFRIGSITKQFTAATVLRLAEQGKLSLDDPLTKFLPGYPAPGGAATIRQLLNHTSGIMDYTRIPGWMAEANTDKAYTTDQLVAVFRDQPSPFKPGERWDYDNSGYVLLGAVIEKVTGKPWDQAVADLVTRPVHIGIRSGVGEASIPNMASGYTETDGKLAPASKIHMSVPGGAGALVGTVGDLATWADALHNGRLLSPASYAAMSGSTTTADGKTVPYGFGLQTGDVRGHRQIGHNGGIFGFVSDSIYLPKEKIFVAVLANSDSPQSAPGTVARRLAALALSDPYPNFSKTAVDAKAIEPLLGVYTFPETERLFFSRGGKYYTKRSEGSEVEAFPAGNNRFFYGADDLTWFEIVRDSAGKPQIAFHSQGDAKPSIGTRKGPPPVETPAFAIPPAMLDLYAGTYTSAVGTFIIRHEGDTLTVKLEQQPTLPMKAIGPAEFEVTRVAAKIRFNLGDGGKVRSITLLQGGQEIEGLRKD
jgi:D-alanyl-D-alanine carboxypeptidase